MAQIQTTLTTTTRAMILAPMALAALTSMAACSAPKEEVKTPAQLQEACKNMVDTVGFLEGKPEDYINGRDGAYRLTDLAVYQETKVGEQVAYFAALATKIPTDADPAATPAPTPTPVATATPSENQATGQAETAPGEKPEDKPADKPGFQQIVTENKILCVNAEALGAGEMHADVEAPLAISAKDGKVPEELPYKVIAQFQRHGEKATVSEKSSAKSTTGTSVAGASPLADCMAEGSNCKFFGLDRKKNNFKLRIEQSDETSKKILVATYRYVSLPKREKPKAPEATPAPTPAQTLDQAQ